MAGRRLLKGSRSPALSLRHPIRSLQIIMEMVKFEHTVFALPFAFMGAVLAGRSLGRPHGLPPASTLGWILLAMVGARTAAMAFNRIVDARYDSENPRTRGRAIPSGTVTIRQAWILTAGAALAFFVAAWQLNRLCMLLSPIALVAVTTYSWTKHFTTWTHVALGAAIGIAPVGAWLAVMGRFGLLPILLWAVVTLWIGGFDIIYALQDMEVDRRLGLHSLPVRVGAATALRISFWMHALMLGLLGVVGIVGSLGGWYYAGVLIAAAILGYEHAIVAPDDLSRVNTAFFTLNGWMSVLLSLFLLIDVW